MNTFKQTKEVDKHPGRSVLLLRAADSQIGFLLIHLSLRRILLLFLQGRQNLRLILQFQMEKKKKSVCHFGSVQSSFSPSAGARSGPSVVSQPRQTPNTFLLISLLIFRVQLEQIQIYFKTINSFCFSLASDEQQKPEGLMFNQLTFVQLPVCFSSASREMERDGTTASMYSRGGRGGVGRKKAG